MYFKRCHQEGIAFQLLNCYLEIRQRVKAKYQVGSAKVSDLSPGAPNQKDHRSVEAEERTAEPQQHHKRNCDLLVPAHRRASHQAIGFESARLRRLREMSAPYYNKKRIRVKNDAGLYRPC
jgi:hypothetical protein